MEREDKAKVVTSDWGAEFVQFLAALAVLSRSIWKKRSNSTYSSKKTQAKQLARQGIEQILPPKQTRRPLPCLLSPSFFYGSRVHDFIQILFKRNSLLHLILANEWTRQKITLINCSKYQCLGIIWVMVKLGDGPSTRRSSTGMWQPADPDLVQLWSWSFCGGSHLWHRQGPLRPLEAWIILLQSLREAAANI